MGDPSSRGSDEAGRAGEASRVDQRAPGAQRAARAGRHGWHQCAPGRNRPCVPDRSVADQPIPGRRAGIRRSDRLGICRGSGGSNPSDSGRAGRQSNHIASDHAGGVSGLSGSFRRSGTTAIRGIQPSRPGGDQDADRTILGTIYSGQSSPTWAPYTDGPVHARDGRARRAVATWPTGDL